MESIMVEGSEGIKAGLEAGKFIPKPSKELAHELINDPVVKAKMIELAPNATVGSEDAVKVFKSITDKLDYKDGEYASKSLAPNGGGRTLLVRDARQIDGYSAEDAKSIGNAHFFNVVKSEFPDVDGLANQIKAWKAAHPKLA